MNTKAGRPFMKNKKIPIGVKLPPYLNDWMMGQPESKAILIETAMVNYYGIPDYVVNSETYIKRIPFTTRTMSVLLENNIDTVEKLKQCTAIQLLKMPKFGRKSLHEVQEFFTLKVLS